VSNVVATASKMTREELECAMNAGKTVREIATEFGLHEVSVRQKLAALALSANAPSARRDAPVADVTRVTELLAMGKSMKEIASHLGVKYKALHSFCMRRGVSSRKSVDEGALVKEYIGGASSTELARNYNMSVTRVIAIIRRHGVTVRTGGPKRIVVPAMDEAVTRYAAGESAREIGSSIGVKHHMVEKWLHSKGVLLRKTKAWKTVNEAYFDAIDSEEKAYWVGFLGADGWVLDDGMTIGLALKESDYSQVKKFAAAIGLNDSRIVKRRRGGVQVIFKSARMWAALRVCGISPRKSESYDPVIPPGFEVAFWRGMVDGDGAIIESRDGVCLAGTKEVCAKFKLFVEREIGQMQKIHVYANYCAVQVEGAVARLLMDKLYSGASTYLDRKYELATGKMSSAPVQRIGWRLAEGFLQQHHYLGTLPVGTVVFGWFDGGLKGVAAFGTPSSPSSAKTIFGIEHDESVWELRRFALIQPSVPNLASKFLASACKELRTYNSAIRVVISYADEGAGHIGRIYQAIGARYVGGEACLYARTAEGVRLQLGRGVNPAVVGATIESDVRHKYILFIRRGDLRKEDEAACVASAQAYPKLK